jgi:hypothetical protein
MYKSTTKCNETLGKWCKNKHGASKIIDTFVTYQPPAVVIHQDLPLVDDIGPHLQVPEQVLQERQVLRRHKPLRQGLVKWTCLPASLAT